MPTLAQRIRALSLLSMLLVTLAPGAHGAEPWRVLFLTQPVGNLAEALAAMAADLPKTELETAFADRLGDRRPGAVVVDDEHLADLTAREEVLAFARAGGTVLLLIEPGQRHYDQANLLLGALKVQVQGLSGIPGEIRVSTSPLVKGLSFDSPADFRSELTGAGVTPLVTAGQRVLVGQVGAGEGTVTVVPALLLVNEFRQGRAPMGRLLAQRVVAAGREAEPPTVASDDGPPPAAEERPAVEGARYLPPAAPTPLPLEARDFAGAVLYDCLAGDDNWPQIHPLVQDLLKAKDLTVKALQVTAEGAPLAEALASGPRLVVLGSWREMGEAEVVALYYYVLGGGRVLALGHAQTSDQIRLVYLNEALYNLGLLLTLGRPAGEATLAPGSAFPLLWGSASLGKLPRGIEVRGWGAKPVLVVDARAVLGYAEVGPGRVLALDAGPLPDNAAYRAALQGGLNWLLMTAN